MTQPESRQVLRSVPTSSDVSLHSATKRLFDIVVGGVLFLGLSPVLLAVGVAIWLDSGTPILYRCVRVGYHGRTITVLKFRTMKNGSHHGLEELLSVDEERRLEYSLRRKLRNDPRRTRIGSFLRRSSLDELPQLLNVIAGQMSLVGPRPYFADELLGRPEAADILSVRPGITGLWQVNGRSERTFEERLTLERDYVSRQSFVLDLWILILTLRAVLTGRGAY